MWGARELRNGWPWGGESEGKPRVLDGSVLDIVLQKLSRCENGKKPVGCKQCRKILRFKENLETF